MPRELNFEAKDTKLRDVLFTAYKKFRVPRYQRPYAWDEDQISDFWNDLTGDDYSNFFGSLIFNTEQHSKTGFYEIIDGQQRLVTITIFCSAIRDIARTIESAKADFFQRRDIAIEDNEGNESYRVVCGETLKTFFETNIQKKNGNILEAKTDTKEEKLVKQNYKFFYEKISSELKSFSENSRKLDYLQLLRNKLHSLPIIQIEIENEDDAYEIFETTNARGVDLTVADLLKNVIFNNLRESEDKDIAKEYWNDIVSNVQETNTELKKFIRYYWISKNSFVNEKKLFKKMKNTVTDWQQLLFDLHSVSEWYDKLIVGNLDAWEDLRSGTHIYKSLLALRVMNVSQCYVLFLAILRNIDKIKTDPRRIFKWVEDFSFKYSAVCKLPGNKLEKLYSSYARKIEEATKDDTDISKRIQSIFEEFKKDLKKEEPGIEQFKEAFRDIAYGRSEANRHLCKYVLSKINQLNQDSEFDFTTVNIEHILPQRPDKAWGLKSKDIKPYVNKLGNLTLVHKKINSSIGNKIIQGKIEELSKSEVRMTLDLVHSFKKNNFVWTENEINERQNQLAEIAYDKVWNID